MTSGRRPTFDVVVVGGGPAGAAAAIEASRRGLDTLVLDKATFPRDKCCGDGLTANALRHLEELGLDPGSVPSWQAIDDVVLVDPRGRERTFPLPRNRGRYAVIARRRELDASLLERAVDSGATVRQGTEVIGIETAGNGDGVRVTDQHGVSHHGRYLLAADGMWSPTRRMLGMGDPDYRGEWHAARQYFRNVTPSSRQRLHVWFEPDLLPGYVWSFPLADGSANVGYGVLRHGERKGKELRRLWEDVIDRPQVRAVLGPDAVPEDRYTAWPIPARLGGVSLTADRVLFVGDAAAATDPLSGEGIGQALETGRLAAECVAAAGPEEHPIQVTAPYERALRRGMVRDHALARVLSAGLSTPVGAVSSLALAGLTPWTRRNFARWLFEDYPRAVLGTPGRWRPNPFRRAGAYP